MRRDLIKITTLLNKRYGNPGRPKKTDPVDEIVRTILSQNTTDKNSLEAFRALKGRFKSWGALLGSGTGSIVRIIRHGGLANIKARRIKEVLGEIKAREGRVDLSRLKDAGVKYSLGYLESLKGVGPKTAACVLLFSFGKPVMPVDTHIFRVAGRLGLIKKGLSINKAHEVLTDAAEKTGLIYAFHLGIIMHGRRTCKARNPKCGICVLYNLCAFPLKRKFSSGGIS